MGKIQNWLKRTDEDFMVKFNYARKWIQKAVTDGQIEYHAYIYKLTSDDLESINQIIFDLEENLRKRLFNGYATSKRRAKQTKNGKKNKSITISTTVAEYIKFLTIYHDADSIDSFLRERFEHEYEELYFKNK